MIELEHTRIKIFLNVFELYQHIGYWFQLKDVFLFDTIPLYDNYDIIY